MSENRELTVAILSGTFEFQWIAAPSAGSSAKISVIFTTEPSAPDTWIALKNSLEPENRPPGEEKRRLYVAIALAFPIVEAPLASG